MKKSTSTIAWLFYLVSIPVLAYGSIQGFHHKYAFMILGCLILTVPWIICLINSVKPKNSVNGLWPYFIFFFGLVAMPFYLFERRKIDKDQQLT